MTEGVHPAGTRKGQTEHNPKSPLATPKERRVKSPQMSRILH
jgi:hypothetical protein